MAQMKEQNKIPEKEQNEMEITNLSDAEFKTLVIRMLRELIEYRKKINKGRKKWRLYIVKKKKKEKEKEKYTGNQQWRERSQD